MCFAPQRRALFSTSQLPKVVRPWCVFAKMCFAPQRRALFGHRNFQKWSDHGVFCTFWLQKCASRHKRRALFRHLNFQKWSALVFCPFWLGNVLRTTTACTFFMSHLASWLRTRRFSEPTFSTLRSHKSLEKHSESRLSYLFAHLPLLFFWSFLFWLFSPLLFNCPYCRKFHF